jgi:hypothetical protein
VLPSKRDVYRLRVRGLLLLRQAPHAKDCKSLSEANLRESKQAHRHTGTLEAVNSSKKYEIGSNLVFFTPFGGAPGGTSSRRRPGCSRWGSRSG